jgi:hypothetical protein
MQLSDSDLNLIALAIISAFISFLLSEQPQK